MNEMAPCEGCTERYPACHGSCDKYKEWYDRYQAQQKHLAATKNRWQSPWTDAKEKRTRSEIKFGSYGHKKGGDQ